MSAPLAIALTSVDTELTRGSVQQMLESARALAARGHGVTVVSPPDRGIIGWCGDHGLPHVPLARRSPLDPLGSRALARALDLAPPQVLHAYGGRSLLAALAVRRHGGTTALVAMRRVSFPLTWVKGSVYRARRVRRVVCACEAIRRTIIETGGVAPERAVVVPDGVDPDRFDPKSCQPQRIRAELSIEETTPLVVHVGMRDWKGWRELLRAFPAVRERVPAARLVLVGCRGERQREAVGEMVAEMGLAGHVAIMLHRQDIPDILAAADVVVDPSWAGTGIAGTIREALALGRPVVAADAGGNGELVSNNETGILVPPRDVASLAAAIVRMLSEPELAGELARAGRRLVRREFTTAVRARRLESVYRQAVGPPARRRRI